MNCLYTEFGGNPDMFMHLLAKIQKDTVAVLFAGTVGILFDTPLVSDLMKQRRLAGHAQLAST